MEKIENKPKIFVIMPFGDTFFEAYEMIKNHFENRFDFSNAAAEDNQQNILSDIFPPIYQADVVLADLTGLNPNVMYELGVAHTFGKKTIIITQDELEKLPFDLKQYRAKKYSTYFKSFMELLEYLDKNLAGAIDGTVFYSNPIMDTMEKSGIVTSICQPEKVKVVEMQGDKGFLDFLTEIEEDANEMTANINELVESMNTLNKGTVESSEELNKVSGNGKAAFARKQARKIAGLLNTFKGKLKTHNELNGALWNKIETNILGLLENDFAKNEDNKANLIELIKSLHSMKSSSAYAKESFSGTITQLRQLKGIERTLTQTINFIEEDFKSYNDWSDQIVAGIDRIIAKSKFVVGEIDFDQN